jgi:hypothetical protein
VKTSSGYLLYEYDPERGIFVDSGYAKNLEDLDFKIRARYGFHKSVHLVSFEEVVKMFDAPLPRIIQLSRSDVFCVREGDVLFSAKWDYDADGHAFIKRLEWQLDGEEPTNIAEALRRLSEYAEKSGRWIVVRYMLKSAVAYEVYPEQ